MRAKSAGKVSTALGTLDEFLDAHANDFSNFRYYNYGGSKKIISDDYKACLLAILGPLAKRDPETWANLLQHVPKA